MSSLRYRRLITNLPSLATVVNSFQTPEVQRDVFRLLIDAMEDAVADDDESREPRVGRRNGRTGKPQEALADLVSGDNIHAMSSDND